MCEGTPDARSLFEEATFEAPTAPALDVPTEAPLQAVGLFAGIGGIELGLSRSDHTTLEFCEIDPSAQAVLNARFPGVPVQDDIQHYRELPAGAELITGGFPCQDLSQAGRTLGLEGDRSSLVGEVFWLARHHDVPWLLLENVSFMLRLGGGEALEVILRTLDELEYMWAYRVVDSRAFGLPQRRKRVFILASKERDPRDVLLVDSAPEIAEEFDPHGRACGFYWTEGTRGLGWAVDAVPTLKGGSGLGIPSPPAIWLPSGEIIKPGIRDAERMQGFPADWTLPAESVGRASLRWQLVGNAVTVDVAEWIGQRLRAPGEYQPWGDRPLVPGEKWPDAAYNTGEGRFSSWVSQFPFNRPSAPLGEFVVMEEASLLSTRATSGFLSRFESSSLSRPPGFMDALKEHLRAVRESVSAPS